MAWADSWGHSPCNNARVLAKAFFECRERTFGQSYVSIDTISGCVKYYYKGSMIARYTPEALIPGLIARRLTTGKEFTRTQLTYRTCWGDKGEARHLQALGVDAKWQYGCRPFLIFGVDASARGLGWHTAEEWKALPKWVEPAPTPAP